MYIKASELYNNLLEIFLMNTMIYQLLKEKKMNPKYNLDNSMLDTYEYENWYEEESDESTIKINN